MLSASREYSLAALAFVVRHATWTEFVSRITKGILVLLGWVSGTIRAPGVSTLAACFGTGKEQCLAFVASPPDALSGLLVNQVLTTSLAGPGEDNLLLSVWVRVIGDDRGVLLVGLNDSSSSFAAGDNLGFSTLGRVASTLGATGVLAVGAFLGSGKSGIAFVAGSSDTHANGLVHTENSIVSSCALQLCELDLEAVALAELFGALLKELAASELGYTLHSLILGSSLLSLRQGRRFALDRCLLLLESRRTPGAHHTRETLG